MLTNDLFQIMGDLDEWRHAARKQLPPELAAKMDAKVAEAITLLGDAQSLVMWGEPTPRDLELSRAIRDGDRASVDRLLAEGAALVVADTEPPPVRIEAEDYTVTRGGA